MAEVYNVYHAEMRKAVFSSYDKKQSTDFADKKNADFKRRFPKVIPPYYLKTENSSPLWEQEQIKCELRYP